jgi:tetratricopeptide (TPR) repeat protein
LKLLDTVLTIMCKRSYNSLYINIDDFDKLINSVMSYILTNVRKLKMKKARYDLVSRKSAFLAVLGITALIFMSLVSIVGATQDSTAWIHKGTALGQLGKFGEAIQAYDKAIDLNPQAPCHTWDCHT